MKTKTILATVLVAVCLMNFLSAISIKKVESSPLEVAPGQNVEVSIEIENNLNYDAENVHVVLELSDEVPFAPYQSSSEDFLDVLDEDDEEKFTFKLIVLPETSSGIYKIPVTIEYEDNSGDVKTKTGLISVTVNSKPELRVSLEDSIVLIRGRENELSVKVVNSGLADVKFLYITVNDFGGANIMSENAQYIGDIDSDDFDSVNYNLYLSDTASTMISLPVVLKYRDATNKDFTETRTLLMRTYSLKEAQDLGLITKPSYTIYIVIVVLGLGYLGYRKIKKRKKRKE